MPKKDKKKKLTSGDGFSIGGAAGIGVSLGELLGKPPREPGNERPAEKTEPAPSKEQEIPAKLPKPSIQRRRAGCGGKTVTAVIFPNGADIDLEALAKEMRKGLGCGSRVEEGAIILQGDIASRVSEWLEKRKR
mgnify:CR=1 FL=1